MTIARITFVYLFTWTNAIFLRDFTTTENTNFLTIYSKWHKGNKFNMLDSTTAWILSIIPQNTKIKALCKFKNVDSLCGTLIIYRKNIWHFYSFAKFSHIHFTLPIVSGKNNTKINHFTKICINGRIFVMNGSRVHKFVKLCDLRVSVLEKIPLSTES